MKKLLLASVALAALALPAQGAVIANLGVNPTSAQGDFSNSVGGAVFEDQYTFQLVGAQFITFSSATNVFPAATDFITSFTGQLFDDATDTAIGPLVAAVGCPGNPGGCQILAGSAELPAGNYFLNIAGIGGGTSGYGGNLSVFEVPGPLAGAGLIPFLGLIGFAAWRRRKTV
jgi:hypothetical protein